MGAIFSPPKTPKPDPAAERAAQRERERAERERADAVQKQLSAETSGANAQFGRRSLLSAGQAGFRSMLGG